MRIEFTIPGPPQGKARPRVVRMKNGFSTTYTPDKTVYYEDKVRLMYSKASSGQRFPDDTALRMTILSGYPIAQSKSKKLQAAMMSGAIRPTKKPDGDNIVKIICDALNGLAYKDDAQVVEIIVSKKYVAGAGETFVRIEFAR